MGIKQTVAPTTTPITLEEAKEHAYVIIADDDDLITSMIEASTQLCESYTSLQLSDATYEQSEQLWDNFILLKNPVKSITSVQYYDTDDNIQTLSWEDFFYLDDYQFPNRLVMKQDASFPDLSTRINPIIITFVAGYNTVPSPILSWIKIQTATFYKQREEFTSFQSYEVGNRFSIRLLDNYVVDYV